MLSSSGFDLSYPFLSFLSFHLTPRRGHMTAPQQHADACSTCMPASRRWNRRATNWCTPGSRRPGDRIWIWGESWRIALWLILAYLLAHLLIKHTLICFDDLWFADTIWYSDTGCLYPFPILSCQVLIPRRSRMWHLHLSSLSTSARASNKCKGIRTHKGRKHKIVLWCIMCSIQFMLHAFLFPSLLPFIVR